MFQLPENKLIIIGCSAGGLESLVSLLKPLPLKFLIPIVIIQHLGDGDEALLIDVLSTHLALNVNEAVEGSSPKSGAIDIAPGGYHLLFERNGSYSLSLEAHHKGSRPSLDISFESAIDSYGSDLIAIVLSGNNRDGRNGASIVLDGGGTVYVQDPEEASFPVMPSAVAAMIKDRPMCSGIIYSLEKITESLLTISGNTNEK